MTKHGVADDTGNGEGGQLDGTPTAGQEGGRTRLASSLKGGHGLG
eukprot:CAMPEP_0174747820 /NCGR_PEP_ID=MMETSP1094-20130205/92147_1 /TAXON_ID=156173 /ORGANISM="Chrysochromulina brevifilum, Strain UTEX LB 985" /LENGTH=44 /DNA_ID= /DNA_START= /DNA_END= /DNA_ORIENTATION=